MKERDKDLEFLRKHELYDSSQDFKKLVDEISKFLAVKKLSSVMAASELYREKQNEDERFYRVLINMLADVVKQPSTGGQNQTLRKALKWYGMNRDVLHVNNSKIDKYKDKALRISSQTQERADFLRRTPPLPTRVNFEADQVDDEEENISPNQLVEQLAMGTDIGRSTGDIGRSTGDIGQSSGELRGPSIASKAESGAKDGITTRISGVSSGNAPPAPLESHRSGAESELDLKDDLLDLPGDDDHISVSTPNSSRLSRSRDDRMTVLIPGATKAFTVTMPIAPPLDQSPLKNATAISTRAINRMLTEAGLPKRRRGRVEEGELEQQMDYSGVWEHFLQSRNEMEDFAATCQFYGRQGSCFTRRYYAHGNSWGPENSTAEVINNYAKFDKLLRPMKKAERDAYLRKTLEDFHSYSESLASHRQMTSRTSRTARQPPPPSRRSTATATAGGVLSSRGHLSTATGAKHPGVTRENTVEIDPRVILVDDEGRTEEGEGYNFGAEDLAEIVLPVSEEMVLNKEQVGPEAPRGYRRASMPINPFKQFASHTIALTPAEYEKSPEKKEPMLLMPGLATVKKMKSPEELHRELDLHHSSVILPGQKQMPTSYGGATARGNRPFTTLPPTNHKDKWNNHQPSDDNPRVSAAANHPYYFISPSVVKKHVVVEQLGKKTPRNGKALKDAKQQPWWMKLYNVAPKSLEEDITNQYMPPPKSAPGMHESDPAISFIDFTKRKEPPAHFPKPVPAY